MFHSMRRLGLVVAGIAAGLTLLSGAQAATISFNAFAFSNEGIAVSGDAVDIIPVVPPSFVNPINEAIKIGYATSGLPYVISKVEITASGTTKFFAPTGDQPAVGPTAGGTSASGGATITGASTGNLLSANFTVGTLLDGSDSQFQQVGSEVFYTGIANGASAELTGHNVGKGLLEPGWSFDGTHIKVTFTLLPGAVGLPATLTLEDNFGVITSPPYTVSPVTLNEARTGHSLEVVPTAVPEPGTLALFVGMGISGSGLLLRRRRR
jgi:hypothetical protein